MIRIDELYSNVFLPWAQQRSRVGLHWFEPFGTTAIENICNLPPVDGVANHRYVFWDQEPLHNDRVKLFFDQFTAQYHGPFSLITSEYQSQDVAWACDTYGCASYYYFFHAWAALDWYRGYNRTFLCQPFAHRRPTKTFLCLNNIIGGQRRHRLELFGEMVRHDMINNNLISFPDSCPYEKQSAHDLAHTYGIDIGSVLLPLQLDQGRDFHEESSRINIWPMAQDSLIHIVTETVFQRCKQHLTEKTFKAIVLQQPFVLVSTRGSLEYLRRYGFQTFSSIWNEDYDLAPDNERISIIASLLKDLDQLSAQEKQSLQRHLVPIVEHNFNWFYSQDFERLLWTELSGMINQWQ